MSTKIQSEESPLKNSLESTSERLQNRQFVEKHTAGSMPAEVISAPHACFGRILSIDESNNQVKVEIENTPNQYTKIAKLGRSFRLEELQMALDNALVCRVEFVAGDHNLPVITDIFFSIFSEKTLVLRAEKIQLEASKELTLNSQQAKTRISGRDGRITTEATYITTQAEKGHFIRGGHVAIN